MPPESKTCTKCGTVRPLDEFPPRPGTPDGHRGVCHPCKKADRLAAYKRAHPNGPGRGNGRKNKIDPNRTEKTCSHCGALKPITDYSRQSTSPDGHRARCKQCEVRLRLERNPRVPRQVDPDAKLRRWLRDRYDLTLDEYRAMHEAQGGFCMICKQACSLHDRLSVDHCHDSGQVRGLLCDRCNKVLGLFRDNSEHLRAAAAYLRAAEAGESDAA